MLAVTDSVPEVRWREKVRSPDLKSLLFYIVQILFIIYIAVVHKGLRTRCHLEMLNII